MPSSYICTDFNSCVDEKSIVAAVTTTQNGNEALRRFYQNGHYFPNDEDGGDIVIVEEIEEPKRWVDDENARGTGWFIDSYSDLISDECLLNEEANRNVFATKKQAKSALAMARISQIMAHDERYGGVVTDKEWKSSKIDKFVLYRHEDKITYGLTSHTYRFLAFHTAEQCDLFLAENEQLVKDYLMI